MVEYECDGFGTPDKGSVFWQQQYTHLVGTLHTHELKSYLPS